jgi:Transposase DDE domain
VSHSTARRLSRQGASQQQLRQLWARPGLPFADLLPTQAVEQALQPEGLVWRDRLYTPAMTIWVFLSQILSPDHSCRQAVANFLAWLVALGRPACSEHTGAYCEARQRLPEGALTRLVRQTGRDLEERSPAGWRWHKRPVRFADGSTVSMPDTTKNQRAYPQPRTQKPGLGFPLARIVIVFSLSVGTVLEAALNPYQGKETGETAMLRALLGRLDAGDILVGDRYYANYWLIALAQQRHIDVVFRQHQLRHVDFRTGQRLGADDHLINWEKPQRPAWMDRATWAALPATLTLRELRIRIPKGKFRTRQIVIVTSLRDTTHYAKSEVQALYRRRWEAEIHIRALKQTLQMDILRCKTPEMVRKEVWAHLLVYNLIRTALARAAEAHDLKPWQISFKGALQTLNAFGGVLPIVTVLDADAYYRAFLEAVAGHRVGDRPDRYEPRKVKRRPKPLGLLTKPRHVEKERFAQGR